MSLPFKSLVPFLKMANQTIFPYHWMKLDLLGKRNSLLDFEHSKFCILDFIYSLTLPITSRQSSDTLGVN